MSQVTQTKIIFKPMRGIYSYFILFLIYIFALVMIKYSKVLFSNYYLWAIGLFILYITVHTYVYLKLHYIITDKKLIIKTGFRSIQILISEIESIKKVRFPASLFQPFWFFTIFGLGCWTTTTLDHLQITFKKPKYWFKTSIIVSPENEEHFLKLLEKKIK